MDYKLLFICELRSQIVFMHFNRRLILHSRVGEPGQSSLLLLLGSHPPCHLPLAAQYRSAHLLRQTLLFGSSLLLLTPILLSPLRFCDVRRFTCNSVQTSYAHNYGAHRLQG